ncbi:MAG: ribosome biogenesis GTPase YlqF [Bacillota bacterium]
MNIQWFPGHMTKTRRMIIENLSMVDVVIEILDARIPMSSKNPEIDSLIRNKPKLVVLNKSDLSDPSINKEWSDYYFKRSQKVIFINSVSGEGISQTKSAVLSIMKEKLDRLKEKGRIFKSTRTMVVGIPNVGKSSFINRLAGKSHAETGDRPGVTRSKQWIRLDSDLELLDTPGILWPKFDDVETGLNLAFTGAIKDDIMDTSELACILLQRLNILCPEKLLERFKLTNIDSDSTGLEILEEAGRKRGCLVSKGEIDYSRISSIVLDEFRGGKIGKITLERPRND